MPGKLRSSTLLTMISNGKETTMTEPRERKLFLEIHGANVMTGLPYLCAPSKWPLAAAKEKAGWLEGKLDVQSAGQGAKGYVASAAGIAAYNAGLVQ